MPAETASRSRPAPSEWRFVAILQILFLMVACFGLNGPIVSTHFVRQNQTFDVARHVYREGWSAVWTPKASFSQLVDPGDNTSPLATPDRRYTIIHLEFPFHGLFGWPFAAIFKQHELAITRLVSVAFSILSIGFCYGILRHWLPVLDSRIGAAIWATSPMVMHFGQVPMPDILATTGMIAAFAFALRGNVAFSSMAFLFSILAKLTVIVYGLPILTALLVANQCRSFGQFLTLSLKWGLLPLAGAAGWYALGLQDPSPAWAVIGGFQPGDYDRIHLANLLSPKFYRLPLVFIFSFGCSLIGSLGLLGFIKRTASPKAFITAAILTSIVANYILGRIAWEEPQYSLPVLFWIIFAAAFGVGPLLKRALQWPGGKVIIAGALALHITFISAAIYFLKASRVSNLPALQEAASHTPADARLVVYSTTLCVSPPVWLNRNTLSLYPWLTSTPAQLSALSSQFDSLKQAGYHYLLVFDLQEPRTGLTTFGRRMNKTYRPTNFTEPNSPIRQYLDGNFSKVFERDHVVLYTL